MMPSNMISMSIRSVSAVVLCLRSESQILFRQSDLALHLRKWVWSSTGCWQDLHSLGCSVALYLATIGRFKIEFFSFMEPLPPCMSRALFTPWSWRQTLQRKSPCTSQSEDQNLVHTLPFVSTSTSQTLVPCIPRIPFCHRTSPSPVASMDPYLWRNVTAISRRQHQNELARPDKHRRSL
jgi:hypothetical protein